VNSVAQLQPALSVILVTPGSYRIIERTVAALGQQTVREQIELVIVCPAEDRLELAAAYVDCFCSVRVVERNPLRTLAAARTAGIQAAAAPIVALGEDHAFPEPGWAEALIQAHRSGCTAAGPEFLNANPSLMSWISLVMDYGRWIRPLSIGPTDDVPGHNSAWKRSVLLDYGTDLERMIQAPTLMHWDLRAKGHQLHSEPAAKVRHVNISQPMSFLRDHFHGARVFAGARSRSWTWIRRLVYSAAAPLFMVRKVRAWRGHIRRIGLEKELFPKAWPILLISALLSSLGEMLGHIFGIGRAEERVFQYDANRQPFLSARERQLFNT
jgi:glycosyltransferase involved in cell wall biosynthesis